VRKAFIAADKALLAPAGAMLAPPCRPPGGEDSVHPSHLRLSAARRAAGFMGMGERGVGGSKCGSTGAILLAYKKGGTLPSPPPNERRRT
jgi:hypothetical protein